MNFCFWYGALDTFHCCRSYNDFFVVSTSTADDFDTAVRRTNLNLSPLLDDTSQGTISRLIISFSAKLFPCRCYPIDFEGRQKSRSMVSCNEMSLTTCEARYSRENSRHSIMLIKDFPTSEGGPATLIFNARGQFNLQTKRFVMRRRMFRVGRHYSRKVRRSTFTKLCVEKARDITKISIF